jgi:acyl carrier protein
MLGAVLEMWREALGADDLGPDDEFFELGGDSLSAVQLMGRIRERFGVEMSIAVLFDCPTARELTTELVRMAAEIA